MKQEYIEKIYAGWLAKIIGIRYGAAIEGWDYERIRKIYGDFMDDYPAQYKTFAADDDSNGPWFFLRALEWAGEELAPQDVARALLNYAPFEHGFFWWGGYGVSTEHTAYLNLRNRIPAPESGSMRQNGKTMAEQIGGQIFSDTWGLVNPGNPERAAKMARAAASVTHDGDGLNGAAFVAACVSAAFVERDIRKIVETGLFYAGRDTGYGRMVQTVMDFYDGHRCDPAEENPRESWRRCLTMIRTNYGYDRYPGICHIIPNVAVMTLALLYGEGDFDRTLEICNLCGWDTDCNVGNVAAIMGTALGLSAIGERWRRPVGDLLIASSVVGSLNIQDIPQSAAYIARMAFKLEREAVPEPWREILEDENLCHFTFPGSTHAMRARAEDGSGHGLDRTVLMENVPAPDFGARGADGGEAGGKPAARALRVTQPGMGAGECLRVFKKTYYLPEDFSDSRYDPAFSPVIYPGQTLSGTVMLDAAHGGGAVSVSMYVKNLLDGSVMESRPVPLRPGNWESVSFEIPAGEALLGEAGFGFYLGGPALTSCDLSVLLGRMTWGGAASVHLALSKAFEEVWPGGRREISQFTRLKGNAFLEDGGLHLSCADFGEMYTGSHSWRDYRAEFELVPVCGPFHGVNLRVQGAVMSLAAALVKDADGAGRLAILLGRHDGSGYDALAEAPFDWRCGETVKILADVRGQRVSVTALAETEDGCERDRASAEWMSGGDRKTEIPACGGVGILVRQGSHLCLRAVDIAPAPETALSEF